MHTEHILPMKINYQDLNTGILRHVHMYVHRIQQIQWHIKIFIENIFVFFFFLIGSQNITQASDSGMRGYSCELPSIVSQWSHKHRAIQWYRWLKTQRFIFRNVPDLCCTFLNLVTILLRIKTGYSKTMHHYVWISGYWNHDSQHIKISPKNLILIECGNDFKSCQKKNPHFWCQLFAAVGPDREDSPFSHNCCNWFILRIF